MTPSQYPILYVQFILLPILFFQDVLAQSNSETSILITVRDRNAINSAQSIVIFLSGSDNFYVNVLQDALTIELRKLHWNVKSRIEVETAVRRDFLKKAKSIPDSVMNDFSKYTHWLTSLPKIEREKLTNDEAGDEASVAQLVDANVYLTGTILVGRHQYVNNDKDFSASSEKIVIITVSFQIIDSAKRIPILESVISYQNGKSATYVAEDIRQVIKNAL